MKSNNVKHFRSLKGFKVPIDLSMTNRFTDYSVSVIGENEDSFIVKDIDGVRVDFPRRIINANQIKILDDRIDLSSSLYNYWIGSERKKLLEAAEKKFRQNFKYIYQNKDLVYKKGEYYLIQLPNTLYVGAAYCGKRTYCLGSLFESWEMTDALVRYGKNDESKTLIISASGSPLSGSNQWVGWSFESENFSYGRDPSFGKLFCEFERLGRLYQLRLRSDFFHLTNLIDEIGVE